jgi:DNA polymerase III alpha subunit (gram-positive type)
MADVTFRFDRAPTGELSGESLVEQTEQALSELGQESSQAEEKAEEAIRIANAASETADQAVATATQAQTTANSALTTAQSAQSTASQAVQTAQSAQTTAQSAVQTAQNAVSTAQSAVTAAQSAQTAAENAESNAADAASAAESSASSASAAQTAAETAQTDANTAAALATQAQEAAARSAQSAAESAQSVAASARQIGEIISSTLPIQSAGIHLLDGALIDGDGIYSAFVDYIAGLYESDPTAAYFTDETSWQTAVTTYGVCGKFVYDSVNETVRLPKITGIVEGTTDLTALGDLIQAGLPNIEGYFRARLNNGGYYAGIANGAGAFYGDGVDGNNVTNVSGYQTGYKSEFNFDASRSSAIYGNSTTVQPQTIKTLVYIVVATVTKTDIQVDIDNIVTDLNNKIDTVNAVDIFSAQTITGVKTFTSSPIVPTPAAGDDSTKVATTAFVAQAFSQRKSDLNSHYLYATNIDVDISTSGDKDICSINLDSSIARYWLCIGWVDVTTSESGNVVGAFVNGMNLPWARTSSYLGGGVTAVGIADAEVNSVATLKGFFSTTSSTAKLRGSLKVIPIM